MINPANVPYTKHLHCNIGPTMEIARGFVIQSTNEYPNFLKARDWLQNKSFQDILSQSFFILEKVILTNYSTNLKQEKVILTN